MLGLAYLFHLELGIEDGMASGLDNVHFWAEFQAGSRLC